MPAPIIANKYALLKKLASGGMAEVFLAKQIGLDGFEKLVVLKRILPHLSEDEEFGEFWKLIYREYQTTKRLLLKITGHKELMENYPDGKASIEVREEIVLPLLTIQQFALIKIQEILKNDSSDQKKLAVYQKMVTRSLFGNINASRNSA